MSIELREVDVEDLTPKLGRDVLDLCAVEERAGVGVLEGSVAWVDVVEGLEGRLLEGRAVAGQEVLVGVRVGVLREKEDQQDVGTAKRRARRTTLPLSWSFLMAGSRVVWV